MMMYQELPKVKMLFLVVAGLALRNASSFTLGVRNLPLVSRHVQTAAIDDSLSALLAADVRAAQADSSLWTPKAVPLLESTARHVIIDDTFTQQEEVVGVLKTARNIFDATHNRPDRASTERAFRWEYWNAGGGQYAHLRTPAASFFGPPIEGEDEAIMAELAALGVGDATTDGVFPALVDLITSFGQRQLGMNSITPPWLSCYVEGHEQRLHTDPAHGPWAFVLSLTPDEVAEAMSGGETQILKPNVLDFWRGFDGFAKEQDDLFEVVSPQFGRFLAFDPRFPHGVRAVHGPRQMAAGRLVLHGWFSDPVPFWSGGLAAESPAISQASEIESKTAGSSSSSSSRSLDANQESNKSGTTAGTVLDAALNEALSKLEQVGRVTGCLSVRVTVAGASGKVLAVDSLADSLVPDPEDFVGAIGETELGETIYEDARADVLLALSDALTEAQFPVAENGQNTEITVPFLFE